MKKGKSKRRWSNVDLAYLNGNLSKSNIKLSEDLDRTIESIESMKRNIRNGKTLNIHWCSVYNFRKPDYNAWKTFTETYENMYNLDKIQKNFHNDGSAPQPRWFQLDERLPSCGDSTIIENKIRHRLSEDELNDRRRFLLLLVLAGLSIGILLLILKFM
jgi:hypothetical protein